MAALWRGPGAQSRGWRIESSAMSQPIDRIILASASPRRAELLSAAGIDFEIQPADVDETIGAENDVPSTNL